MDHSEIAALMGLGELVVGAFYALFFSGPHIPSVPRPAMFFLRLIAPLPLLIITSMQWAYAPAKQDSPNPCYSPTPVSEEVRK